MLDFKRIGTVGARFQQHDFHGAAVFCIADVGVPVLRYFAHDGFVGQAYDQDVVFVVIGCVHGCLLQNRKMVHDRFDDHTILQYQYGAKQIIVPLREYLECP